MQTAEYPLDRRYLVYSDGRIKGPKGKFLKTNLNQGYEYLRIGGKTSKVHRIVCETFIPKIEGMNLVNHKNCIRNDNRLENLEWCNQKMNVRHAVTMGRIDHKGENNSRNIIPKEHIPIIREAIYAGYSPIHISRYYGVHQNTIYQIKYCVNWRS